MFDLIRAWVLCRLIQWRRARRTCLICGQPRTAGTWIFCPKHYAEMEARLPAEAAEHLRQTARNHQETK